MRESPAQGLLRDEAMGVWGTAVFSDAAASDIREEYIDHLGNGLSGPEATARIFSAYKSSLDDPDECGVVWLALAAIQSKHGRLEPHVFQQALSVIDSRSDLSRWPAGTSDHAKQKAVLEKLREQLNGPQPAARPVRKRALCECNWAAGHVISYTLLSGKKILFRVIDHHTEHIITEMMVVGIRQRSSKRFAKLTWKSQPAQEQKHPSVVHVKYLDKFLADWFFPD